MDSKPSLPPPLTLDELSDIISTHRLWLRSAGQEGQEAELVGANLEGLDLDGYDLFQLDFQGANLARVKFGDAQVEDTNFRGADLREADLRGALGLLGPLLAGSDLSGATLPEDVEKFESLPHVNAAIKHAQSTFFTLLLVCVFCWLAIAITTDAGLITNTIETSLPVINTKMNIAAFYIAAPLLLFCLYIYLQLRQQRLWEALSELPAVFPDGQPLPYHLHPWLGSGLLWTFLPRLRHRTQRPNLIWVENQLFRLLSGWLAPLTILALWWRSLPAHSWLLNGPQIALLSPALAAALIMPMYAQSALRLRASRSEMLQYAWGVSVITVIGAVAVMFSYYAFTGWFAEHYQAAERDKQLNPIILGILETLSDSTCANLQEVEISTKPPNWSGKPEEAKGANLRGKDLRHARAYRAFLVGADLRFAQLQGANLWLANLQGANLQSSNLQGANLGFANLQGANLELSNLQGANLVIAMLQGANLVGAQLQGARLLPSLLDESNLRNVHLTFASGWPLAEYPPKWLEQFGLPQDHNDRLARKDLSGYKLGGVDFTGCDLTGFNLKDAFLQGADFQGARGLKKDQVLAASCWPLAKYSQEMLKSLQLPPEHKDRLEEKDLSGYQLAKANFRGADLSTFNLRGANLQGADLEKARLWKADLAGADLDRANLQQATLQNADFQGARGLKKDQVLAASCWPLAKYSQEMLKILELHPEHNERLRKNDLSGYQLPKVDLRGANLSGFNLNGTDLQSADLERANLMAALDSADLRGADLRGANLRGAFLNWADLDRANLQQATLQNADFRAARGLKKNQVLAASCWPLAKYSQEMLKSLQLPPEHNDHLEKKDLHLYQLPKANLRTAYLPGFNLRGANLQGTDLEKAYFSEADLTGADLRNTNLKGAGLREAKGLNREQLKSAEMDEYTKLPDDLKDLVPSRSKKP